MAWNIRMVSTYPPRRCGIGTFCRDLSNALSQFSGEVGHIRIAAIDNNHGPYNIPVDLVIDQYNLNHGKMVQSTLLLARRKLLTPLSCCCSMSTALTPMKKVMTVTAQTTSKWQKHFQHMD